MLLQRPFSFSISIPEASNVRRANRKNRKNVEDLFTEYSKDSRSILWTNDEDGYTWDNLQPSLKTDDENHRFLKFLLRMSVIVSLYNYVATSSDTFEFKLWGSVGCIVQKIAQQHCFLSCIEKFVQHFWKCCLTLSLQQAQLVYFYTAAVTQRREQNEGSC